MRSAGKNNRNSNFSKEWRLLAASSSSDRFRNNILIHFDPLSIASSLYLLLSVLNFSLTGSSDTCCVAIWCRSICSSRQSIDKLDGWNIYECQGRRDGYLFRNWRPLTFVHKQDRSKQVWRNSWNEFSNKRANGMSYFAAYFALVWSVWYPFFACIHRFSGIFFCNISVERGAGTMRCGSIKSLSEFCVHFLKMPYFWILNVMQSFRILSWKEVL